MAAVPDNEALLQEYLKQLACTPHNTKQLFAVGMVGLVGSGKSTVATELARRCNLFITRNDAIRRFLNAKGLAGDHPAQQTLEYIAESTGKWLYAHKVSHVIDADLLKFSELARQNAVAGQARFYLIKLECPDTIIRERILLRAKQVQQGSDNDSRADISEYERRKAIFEASVQPEYDFVVRTDQPLDAQLDIFCVRLKNDGVIR